MIETEKPLITFNSRKGKKHGLETYYTQEGELYKVLMYENGVQSPELTQQVWDLISEFYDLDGARYAQEGE